MRSAFYGVDIIDIGVYLLGEAAVVAKGYIDRNSLIGRDADRLRNELGSAGIEIIDKFFEAFV